MKKSLILWAVVITSSLSMLDILAVKSRRARRRARAQQMSASAESHYTTTVSVEGQDDTTNSYDLARAFSTPPIESSVGSLQNKESLSRTMANHQSLQKTVPPIVHEVPDTSLITQKKEDAIAQTAFEKNNTLDNTKDLSTNISPLFDNSSAIDEDIKIALSEEPTIIEFHFEDADLEQLITQIEQLFGITFITNDAIKPLPEGSKPIKGNKISFKTQRSLNKAQAWNLFTTFLQLAGFSVVPDAHPRFYHIVLSEKAKREPIPAFIGTEAELLPDNEQMIRYVYFIQNSTIDMIKSVIEPLRSGTSSLTFLDEIKAFLIIDHAYNIKSLMRIVKELDKVSIPQSMSVLKLQRADAQDVQQLYETLIQKESPAASRLFPRKKPTSRYFPESTRIIAEPRTNALILLGPPEAIKKIEDFIIEHVDVEINHPYLPLKVYTLKYAEAETIAKIMTEIVQFGKETQAGKVGGVRSGDKYLRDITFTAEPKTNRIIIKGEQEDYEKAIEIIRKLDEPQPQVAIEVLVLTVQLRDNKELGAQIRSRESEGGGSGLLGNNIKFQTSGLRAGGVAKGIVTNPNGAGVTRLLGDLVNLVLGAPAGNTIVTLGQDAFGVWGILQALQTISNTEILANPFLVATNKTTASVAVGEKRRVVSGTIIGTSQTQTFSDDTAELKVTVTPQINSDGMIVLKLNISISAFNPDSNQINVAKATREIDTETIVADREVLALGGLIQNRIDNNLSKTPLLGDIPIFGWLFKNKRKAQDKNNLLILISSRIIEPRIEKRIEPFTQEKIVGYNNMLGSVEEIHQRRDPIQRAFFDEEVDSTTKVVDNFLFKRHHDSLSVAAEKEKVLSLKKRDKQSSLLVPQSTEKEKAPLVAKPTPIANNHIDTPENPKHGIAQLLRKRRKHHLTDLMKDDVCEGPLVC